MRTSYAEITKRIFIFSQMYSYIIILISKQNTQNIIDIIKNKSITINTLYSAVQIIVIRYITNISVLTKILLITSAIIQKNNNSKLWNHGNELHTETIQPKHNKERIDQYLTPQLNSGKNPI